MRLTDIVTPSAKMPEINKPISFALIQHRNTLDDWLADCKRRLGLRFPNIAFDSNCWPIRTLYATEQRDWYFTSFVSTFAEKDNSYLEAIRCLVAEIILAGKPKSIPSAINGLRLLALAPPNCLFDLTLKDLRNIEETCLIRAKNNPAASASIFANISGLAKTVAQLGNKGITPRLGFHVSTEVKASLRKITKSHLVSIRAANDELRDRKIEALNDAFNRMDDRTDNDTLILSPADRVAICASVISLCAPSRINEVLCLSIDDYVTVENYAEKPVGELDAIHRAHQMLIITMKGSKGAEWSPKPALEFMIDVFHYCIDIIKEHSNRSRMLVKWYQKNPTTLYLPPELEYLRGNAVCRSDLSKIIHLSEHPPLGARFGTSSHYFVEIKEKILFAKNPQSYNRASTHRGPKTIELLPWVAIEEFLLLKVHQALKNCRNVTLSNRFEGDLAKMLFLFDSEESPFLPTAIKYNFIRRRLKQTKNEKNNYTMPPTLFEKLNITMPVNGKIQIAEIDSHDPRRWLTTMALTHGENLSDVLINKWANRRSLAQLKAYDFRTPEHLAEFSKMPEAPKLTELTDLSNGLAALEKLEERFGLKTAVVAAHEAGIGMTSMDWIVQATENRPVANSSQGIIILYPQRFGVCLHQHHETPCRNYSNSLVASCLTCNEGLYVKGHIPSNDETRKIAQQVFASIIRHLENLAHTHNRGVADDQDALAEHMLTLVQKGISTDSLEQVAIHLIDEFHQIKHLIKDQLFAKRLEQAFVTRGVVKYFDDSDVANGALIKYHDPKQHANPLLEVALDSHGGRGEVEREEQVLIEKYPQFAPKALGLKDERHLIAPDEEEEED